MRTVVEWLQALSPRMRKLVRIALALMAAQALLIVLRAGEFVFGAPTSVWAPTTLLMFALAPAGIGVSLRMRSVRLAEQAGRERERLGRAEFLRLRAPNPAPGQCPVCGLADLDERAVGDGLLGDAGTALARVVPYGPDRAHAECAAVVPYAAPPLTVAGGATQVAAKGSRMARWLAPTVEAEGERLLAALRVHAPELPPSGSHAWEHWRQRGFLRHEAQAWYQAGFTPWRAADLREQGFMRPRDLPEGLRRSGLGE